MKFLIVELDSLLCIFNFSEANTSEKPAVSNQLMSGWKDEEDEEEKKKKKKKMKKKIYNVWILHLTG